jgi:hypothetical protein
MSSKVKTFVLQASHFVRHSVRESRGRTEGQGLMSMLTAFRRWRASLGQRPMDEALPWMSYAAIDFLRENMRADWSVFEWGVGGSTVFLVAGVGRLVSVEHDTEWADNVRSRLASQGPRAWELLSIPPVPLPGPDTLSPSNPHDYVSAVEGYRTVSFRTYASSIDSFDDRQFDLVIVDGRCRPSCAMHAIPRIKPGGYLLVDDCERERYSWIHDEMRRRNWRFRYFNGPGPFVWEFRHTGCWQRPLENGRAPMSSQ